MAPPPSSEEEEIKKKVQAVRELIHGHGQTNNNIITVLKHFDYDVDQTVAAFIKDGAKVALQPSQMNSTKMSGKSKRKKGRGSANQEPPKPSSKSPTVSGRLSVESSGSGKRQTDSGRSSRSGLPANGSGSMSSLAGLDGIDGTDGNPDTAASPINDYDGKTMEYQDCQESVASTENYDLDSKVPLPPTSATMPDLSDTTAAQPVADSHSGLADIPLMDYRCPTSLESDTVVDHATGAYSNGSSHAASVAVPAVTNDSHDSVVDSCLGALSNSTVPAAVSASSSSNNIPSGVGNGSASTSQHPSAVETTDRGSGGDIEQPPAVLTKACRDLQRQISSLSRLESVCASRSSCAIATVRSTFDRLRAALNSREEDVTREVEAAQRQTCDALTSRRHIANSLKKLTQLAHEMDELQRDALRCHIKNFVSERGIDQDLSCVDRFVCDVDGAVQQIKSFGSVNPLKTAYTYTSSMVPSSPEDCRWPVENKNSTAGEDAHSCANGLSADAIPNGNGHNSQLLRPVSPDSETASSQDDERSLLVGKGDDGEISDNSIGRCIPERIPERESISDVAEAIVVGLGASLMNLAAEFGVEGLATSGNKFPCGKQENMSERNGEMYDSETDKPEDGKKQQLSVAMEGGAGFRRSCSLDAVSSLPESYASGSSNGLQSAKQLAPPRRFADVVSCRLSPEQGLNASKATGSSDDSYAFAADTTASGSQSSDAIADPVGCTNQVLEISLPPSSVATDEPAAIAKSAERISDNDGASAVVGSSDTTTSTPAASNQLWSSTLKVDASAGPVAGERFTNVTPSIINGRGGLIQISSYAMYDGNRPESTERNSYRGGRGHPDRRHSGPCGYSGPANTRYGPTDQGNYHHNYRGDNASNGMSSYGGGYKPQRGGGRGGMAGHMAPQMMPRRSTSFCQEKSADGIYHQGGGSYSGRGMEYGVRGRGAGLTTSETTSRHFVSSDQRSGHGGGISHKTPRGGYYGNPSGHVR